MFASHFPSDEVQDVAEVRGSIPVSTSDWGARTRPLWPYSLNSLLRPAVAILIQFALYWASLISLRAMQLEAELLSAIVVLFVDSFLPFLHFEAENTRPRALLHPLSFDTVERKATTFSEWATLALAQDRTGWVV